MKEININEFLSYFEHKVIKKGNSSLFIKDVSTDTRTLKENALFLPLPGESFNAHDFVADAIKKGAKAVIVREDELPNLQIIFPHDVWVFSVCDTLLAYHQMAASYLSRFKNLKKIAITGTSGKTTTKEIVKSIISTKYRVHSNYANFNNKVGVPKTAFEIDSEHEVGIFEMGMGAPYDVEKLSKIVRPDICIITSIGEGHLEFFNDVEEIALTKKGIFKYCDENSYAILSLNTNLYSILIQNIVSKLISFDEKKSEKIKILKDRGLDGYDLDILGEEVFFSLGGMHNLLNLHFGLYTADILGLSKDEIVEGIKNISLPGMRNQIKKGDYTTIVDCYNANPSSMKASLDFFNSIKPEGDCAKIAVLGDMLELGNSSATLHFEAGKYLGQKCRSIDYLFVFGELAKNILKGAEAGGFDKKKTFSFNDKTKLIKELKKVINKNDMILFKASRGMKLEEVADGI